MQAVPHFTLPIEAMCQRICAEADVLFMGIQHGIAHIPDQCLFQRGPNATTLCLPAKNISVKKIVDRLASAEVEARFHFQELTKIWEPPQQKSQSQRGSQRGMFVLDLLVSMVILTTLLAMAVPSMIGVIRQQNEKFAAETLKRVAVAEKIQFDATGTTGTCTLSDALPSTTMPAGLMDAQTATGTVRGYKFTLTSCAVVPATDVTPQTFIFKAWAQPVAVSSTAGTRSFFVNQTGNVLKNYSGGISDPTVDTAAWGLL